MCDAVESNVCRYLMDPKMEFVKFFGKNTDADLLAEGVINEIKQRKKVGAWYYQVFEEKLLDLLNV